MMARLKASATSVAMVRPPVITATNGAMKMVAALAIPALMATYVDVAVVTIAVVIIMILTDSGQKRSLSPSPSVMSHES